MLGGAVAAAPLASSGCPGPATSATRPASASSPGRSTPSGRGPGRRNTLYSAFVDRVLESDAGYMSTAYDAARPVPDQLVEAGNAYLRFCLERPGYFRLLAAPDPASPPATDPQLVERIGDRVQLQVRRLAALISAGAAAGEVAAPDPELAAVFLHGA